MTTPVELLERRLTELESNAAGCRELLQKAREDVDRRSAELAEADDAVAKYRAAIGALRRK